MLSSPLFSLAFFLFTACDPFVVAHPTTLPPGHAGQFMALHRRSPSPRTTEEWGKWAKAHKEMLTAKYGSSQQQRRSSGMNLLTNQNADSSFFGSLAIGTPPVSFNVILDTGSADLWVADSNCVTGCSGVATFDSTASSSFASNAAPFSITYGSGQASGTLAQDTIQMAGFSVSNQTFGVCDTISSNLLTPPVSGLLGLAFGTIASSKATPFWETLVASGAWDSPVMSFQLTRYLDNPSAKALEPGGTFTMGFVNSSLYTGDIEYTEMPTTASYWILSMTSLTVQGQSVSLPSGSDSYSAIDTGTTLVGGPSQYVSAIFAQIPGAAPGTGNFDGYYTYPCDTTVNITVAFGGKNWPISPADFRLTQLTETLCLGAFFDLATGRSAPSWIVGDTFLKNVYSVFRYEPPSVGFAQLSSMALEVNAADGTVPSATIGSVAATVAATGRSSRNSELGFSPTPFTAMTIFWSTTLIAGILL